SAVTAASIRRTRRCLKSRTRQRTTDSGQRTGDRPPNDPARCPMSAVRCPIMKYTRELTSLVAAPFAIWIIGWAHEYVFDATIALIAGLALYEFLILGERKGYRVPKTICLAVMLFILAAFVLEPISVEMGVFLALLLIPASYVLNRGNMLEEALPSSAIAVMATLYVGMLGGSLIRIRKDFPLDGPKLVFFLLIVVWIGDAGAYYVGRTFGKHRLS